ncbi:MAG: hypothetical protein K2Z81_05885 [Cyanobacteria bacterium]|nr:hypothetical protein [Cyanobacteriota bacterium]
MTTTLQKTEIKPTWKLEQVQELNARMVAENMLAAMAVLGKHGGEEATKEFQTITRGHQVEYYRGLGVKTPLDLIKAKAEFETNVFGSKVEIRGTENEATLDYLTCAVWKAMQKHLNKEQEEKMGECFSACVSNFAQEFGFVGEVKFEGERASITIRK